jgi:hypothetical protein
MMKEVTATHGFDIDKTDRTSSDEVAAQTREESNQPP